MDYRYTFLGLLVFTSFLFGISAGAAPQDPKKTFFTFDEEDQIPEDAKTGADDPVTEATTRTPCICPEPTATTPCPEPAKRTPCPDCTEHIERTSRCWAKKNANFHRFSSFLRFIQKTAYVSATEQTITFDLTVTQSELEEIESALKIGTFFEDNPSFLTHFQLHQPGESQFLKELRNVITEHGLVIIVVSVGPLGLLCLIYWLVKPRSRYSLLAKIVILCTVGVVTTCYPKFVELAWNKVALIYGIISSLFLGNQGFYEILLSLKKQFYVLLGECLRYCEAVTVEPVLSSTIFESISDKIRFILTLLCNLCLYKWHAVPILVWVPVGIITVLLSRYFAKFILYCFRNRFFSTKKKDIPVTQQSSEKLVQQQPSASLSSGPSNDSSENLNPGVASENKDSKLPTVTSENGDLKCEVTSENGGSKDEVTTVNGDSKREVTTVNGDSKSEVTPEKRDSKDEVTSENGDSKREVTSENGDSKREVTSENGDSKSEVTPENGDSKCKGSPENADSECKGSHEGKDLKGEMVSEDSNCEDQLPISAK